MSDVFAAEVAAKPRRYYGGILTQQVELVLCEGDFTADEIAIKLGKSMLSIRPRVSELARDGLIKKTGERPLTVRSLEESATAIRSTLEKQRFQSWLDAAKGHFPITTNTPALEAISAQTPKNPTEVSP